MANDLYSVMTRDEAINEFVESVLPAVVEEYEQDGILAGPARREAWNNFTAYRGKDGTHDAISDWQYNNWSHPDECERDTTYSRRIVRSNSYTFSRPLF